jgi:hypothetical protein
MDDHCHVPSPGDPQRVIEKLELKVGGPYPRDLDAICEAHGRDGHATKQCLPANKPPLEVPFQRAPCRAQSREVWRAFKLAPMISRPELQRLGEDWPSFDIRQLVGREPAFLYSHGFNQGLIAPLQKGFEERQCVSVRMARHRVSVNPAQTRAATKRVARFPSGFRLPGARA